MQNRKIAIKHSGILWSLLVVVLYYLATGTAAEKCVNSDTDYVVLDMNDDAIVVVLQICWNGKWYYVCEDSLTENAVKAFCRSSFYVDGYILPSMAEKYFPLVSVDISCHGYEADFTQCSITNSTKGPACPSNSTRPFFCSRRFMSFLELELPEQISTQSVTVLDPSDEDGEMILTHPGKSLRIGSEDINTTYVYKRGLVSFSEPVADPASVQVNDSDLQLLFPFRWNTEAQANNYTTVQAVVHNRSDVSNIITPQMRVAWMFLYFGTDIDFKGFFIPETLVIIEWRNLTFPCCPDQPVDFQVVLIGDRTKTYSIYTYYCKSGLSPYDPDFIPNPISGTVGVSIEDIFDREFRYSNTDYAVEMRCINRIVDNGFDYDWYNLYYDLTDISTKSGGSGERFDDLPGQGMEINDFADISDLQENMLLVERGSCVERFSESQCVQTSCCQVFTDPSSNCEVISRQGSCFCDGLCFERGDCCDDIDAVEIKSCVPLCQEKQINTIADRYYPDGPVFVCEDGFPHFTDKVTWNESIIQNTAVICSNLLGIIDSQTNEGSTSLQPFFLPEMSLYIVEFYFSCPFGFEESLLDCQLPYEENRKLTYEEIATVSCSADIPYCDERGSINLTHAGSANYSMGVVQICHYGVWIPICGEEWGDEEASLACEQLGFMGNLVSAMSVPTPANISQLIINSFPIVKCLGTSSSLESCIVSGQQCSLSMVAFVDCDYIPPPSPSPMHGTNPTIAPPAESLSVGEISAIIIALFVAILGVFVVGFLVCCYMMKRKKKLLLDLHRELTLQGEDARYIGLNKIDFSGSLYDPKRVVVADPELLKRLTENLIITNLQLRLLDSIGQGEFGLVYKGHWFPEGSAMPTAVAVKTLKGAYSAEDVDEFLRESIHLQQFNHPNVMGLLGVCLDAGPTPYIVLPFMSGGSLLSYIKNKRSTLVLSEESADEDDIQETQKLLVSMCHQVAKGMAYLANQKFIHRDLAARNCMIDHEGVIKVADFGLSKNTYEKMYFRQDKSEGVKLPIKWMALESMEDAVFSEKTDVWSYGVTCWEIFSGGKVPYPGISPMSLPSLLEEGHRMEKPHNAACSSEIFDLIMLRCWWKDPDDRPTFSDLESDLSNFLTSVAGYLDFNDFSLAISSDPDPVPSPEGDSGLPMVASEEQCVEQTGQEVENAEIVENLL